MKRSEGAFSEEVEFRGAAFGGWEARNGTSLGNVGGGIFFGVISRHLGDEGAN